MTQLFFLKNVFIYSIIHRSGPAAVYTATGLCTQFDPSKTFFPPPGQIAQRDRRPAVVQEIDPSILLREPLILKVKESEGRNQKASLQG